MSYWSLPVVERQMIKKFTSRDEYPYELEMIKTVADLLNKAYNNVHLITDDEGRKKLSGIEWSSIDTSLNDLPKEYHACWSLGKIKAYNIIAQRGEPFLHFDGDFFINQRLPKHIEEKPIIFQSREHAAIEQNYVLRAFKNFCPFKHFTAPVEKCIRVDSQENCFVNGVLPKIAYNCGIVGGSDMDYFFNYTESALKTVFDPLNKPYFVVGLDQRKRYHPNMATWTPTIIAEQYYAAMVAKMMDKEPYFLAYPDIDNPREQQRMKEWLQPAQLTLQFEEPELSEFRWMHLQGHYKVYYEQIFHQKDLIIGDPFRNASDFSKKFINQ